MPRAIVMGKVVEASGPRSTKRSERKQNEASGSEAREAKA
jgi:hypothetical protein